MIPHQSFRAQMALLLTPAFGPLIEEKPLSLLLSSFSSILCEKTGILKQAFCPNGRKLLTNISGIENMNSLGKTCKLFYSFSGPLEVLHPFPVPSFRTILRTTKAEPVTFGGQVFPAPLDSYLREGSRHFLLLVFRTFCPL